MIRIKKKIIVFVMLLVIICVSVFTGCNNGSGNQNETAEPNKTVKPSDTDEPIETVNPTMASGEKTYIAICSDIHIGQYEKDEKNMNYDIGMKNLKIALQTYYKLTASDSLDAVVFAGDIVNNGYPVEYYKYQHVIETEVKEGTALVGVMGNHEWYTEGWGLDIIGNDATERYQQEFEAQTGFPVESDTSVNGIHILAVSPDNEGSLYQPREAFLTEQIKAAAKENSNMPIIIIAHKAVKDTTNSSNEGNVYAEWSQEFLDFMANYPQIIYVSGHTHTPLTDEKMLVQKDYTNISDGAVGVNPSQGILLSVDSNYVVNVKLLNLSDGTEYSSYTINIPAVVESKANFTYLG